MNKRIISLLLSILMVFSMLPLAIIADEDVEQTPPAISFHPVDGDAIQLTTETTPIMTDAVSITSPDQRDLTFWIKITDVTEPFYLTGATFAFTTERVGSAGTDSFHTKYTSSYNLQNQAILVTEDGDYTISVHLNDSATPGFTNLAWNYKNDGGGFTSVSDFGIRGLQAAAYDEDGTRTAVSARASMVGIIEGQPNFDTSVTWYDGETKLGETVAEYTDYTPIAINNYHYDGQALRGVTFKSVVYPYSVEPVGKSFVGWADANGVSALPMIADTLYTKYGPIPTQLDLVAKDENGNYTHEIPMSAQDVELYLKLPSADLGIVSGLITVYYNESRVKTDAGSAGKVNISFNKVQPDGTVGKIRFNTIPNRTGLAYFTIEGKVNTSGADVRLRSSNVTFKITGEQPGSFIENPKDVIINSNGEDGSKPREQRLWSGAIPFDNSAGVTMVYKLNGIEKPIIADRFWILVDWQGREQYTSHWARGWIGDTSAAALTFKENGYYYHYLNNKCIDGHMFAKIRNLNIFEPNKYELDTTGIGGNGENRDNPNKEATFTLLAMVEDNLRPTVNFYNEDGSELIYSCEYAYTPKADPDYVMIGKLVSADYIYEASGMPVPEKTSEHWYLQYKFLGWVDENGEKVENVYRATNVYAQYEETDLRPYYDITFLNYDGSELGKFNLPEGEMPALTGATPKKPSTSTKSYKFIGWDKDIVAVDGEATYTAQYEEIDLSYNVTFMAEDKTTWLGEILHIAPGEAVEDVPAPEKPSDPQYDYTFTGWTDANGKVVSLTNITSDITVYASYTGKLRDYVVTFKNEDGTTIIAQGVSFGDPARPPKMTKATTEHHSYVFDGWYDENGNKVDISAISGDITLYAHFDSIFLHDYEDINLNQYYGDAVEYLLINGIMNGTSSTAFSPNAMATRGMFVTVLYRMEKSPDVSDVTLPFTDVKEGDYYYDAIRWAYSNGVVNGVSETKYAPNTTVTREQFVTILYRYAKSIKFFDTSYPKLTSLKQFDDWKDTSLWAQSALKWATCDTYGYLNGIVEGKKTYLKPTAGTTRAQMATILYRFIMKTA